MNSDERFSKHFPFDKDETTLILKTHLLIEATLNETLEKLLPSPKFLDKLNLEFDQKLVLLKALVKGKLLDTDLLSVISTLNTLRNKIAHQLEPKDLANNIENFISLVKKLSSDNETQTAISKLDAALSGLCGAFSGYTDGLAGGSK